MTMNPGGSGGSPILARIAFEYTGAGGESQAPGGSVNPEMIGQGADARAKNRRTEKREEQNADNSDKQTKTLSSHLRSTLGINFGVAAILKQSQIFTGTLGSVFQILGALVDVILVAFMPLIIPAIKLLVKMIPGIKQAADRIVGWLMKGFLWIVDHLGFMSGFFNTKFGKILKEIFFGLIVTIFVARLVGAHKLLLGAVKLVLAGIIAGFKMLLAPLFGIQANTSMSRAGGGGMHPGGGGYAAGGGAQFGRQGKYFNRMGMGPMGMGGAAMGVGMLGLTAATSYGAGGAGAGGLGGSIGGMAVGAVLGGVLGGPAGAMIGANIGAVAGPIIGAAIVKQAGEGSANRDRHNQLGDRDVYKHGKVDWLEDYDKKMELEAILRGTSSGPI